MKRSTEKLHSFACRKCERNIAEEVEQEGKSCDESKTVRVSDISR